MAFCKGSNSVGAPCKLSKGECEVRQAMLVHAMACSQLRCFECRFGKARIFVDGVELLVKRYSFLQQVHLPPQSVRCCHDLSM